MIETEALGFGWPGKAPLFEDVSLNLPAGSATAVLGPNGAGKSTFLRLLAGLEKPAAGRIMVAGLNPSAAGPLELARRIGAVFQSSDRHFLTARVRHEVALGPRTLGLEHPEALARAVLERLDLSAAAEAHPLDLDAGARRLVSFACAIVHAPQVLLLDEVQRGLDRLNRTRLEHAILAEVRRGATVLAVTHDADFARSIADRALRFSRGGVSLEVICQGAPHGGVDDVHVGHPDGRPT